MNTRVLVPYRSATGEPRVLRVPPDAHPDAFARQLTSPNSALAVESAESPTGFAPWFDGPLAQWQQAPGALVVIHEDPGFGATCFDRPVPFVYCDVELMAYRFPAHLVSNPFMLFTLYVQVSNAHPYALLPPIGLVDFSYVDHGVPAFLAVPRFIAREVRPRLPPQPRPLMKLLSFVPSSACPDCGACTDENANCTGGFVRYTLIGGQKVHDEPYCCPPAHPELQIGRYHANTDPGDDDDDGAPTAHLRVGDDVEMGDGYADRERMHDVRHKGSIYEPLAHAQEFWTSLNGTEYVIVPLAVMHEIAQFLWQRSLLPATRRNVRKAMGILEYYCRRRYSHYYPNAQRIASYINYGRHNVLPPNFITRAHNDTFRFMYRAFFRSWCNLPRSILKNRKIILRCNIVFWALCGICAVKYNDPTYLDHRELDPQPDGGPPSLKDPRLRAEYALIMNTICAENDWPILF
jgi:hypothetical protein